MKLLTLISLSLTLVSCATRQHVHIFNEGYSAEEIDKVVYTLNSLGFDASPNRLDIPDEIIRTSIIYPPITESLATLDTVRNSLAQIGHPTIELIYETQGEHYYSTENIGLYLVNPNYVAPAENAGTDGPDSGPQLSRIYYSDCDKLEAELSLFPEGTAILEIYEWNERTSREKTRLIDGEWSSLAASVVFNPFDGGTIRFDYSEFSGRDDYGRYYGIQLENEANTTDIHSCNFKYVTYDVRKPVNRI